ncbi:MAG TPA: aminotransferase class V-fold PLP-dependent enzyme [Chloroflexota bacterium]|nr:aminotransferase class V-fold PLP-dependent enzyme [Chloroflexota bacterium]
MIEALISPSEFVGIDGTAHLCTGGEAPLLRGHLDALLRFATDKGGGMAGRERLFETYRRSKINLSWLVNRPESDIALLAHSSEGVNVVAQAMDWREGDNVVLADVEYPSMIYPWARLATRGVQIRVVPARNWVVHLDDLRATVDERTRIVSASQVSYLTGQRLNLAAVADIAWKAGARLIVDATHALGVVPVDANLCDFLVSSCYKWLLGAHGVGVFVWNRSRVPDLQPANLGWHSVTQRGALDRPTEIRLRPDADRLEVGNPSFPSIYVLNNALERLAELTARDVEQHALGLGARLREGLIARQYQVMTPEAVAARAGNTCFVYPNAEALVAALAERGVLVWGSEGRIRVSGHVYNSSEDVERFFAALDGVAAS